MKYLISTLLFLLITINLQAASYIYTKVEASLPLLEQDVTLYNGVPVRIISKKGKFVEIEINGYINENDKTKLFATPNKKLLLVSVEKSDLIKISGNKGSLRILVTKDLLTDNLDKAWHRSSNLFYNKCTQCHHSKSIEAHTMLEWEALFGSMKEKVKTTDAQNEQILRFLRAFSKDGILRESN